MKSFVILVICLAVIFSAANLNGAEPQTKQGSKSLYFGLGGFNDFGFDNTSLGGQYNFQDNMAVWCELGFQSNSDKANETAQEVKNDMFLFSAGFLYYAFQKGPIAVYFSPQFGVGFGSSENGPAKESTNEFSGGISVGAEWWAFDGVSLTATTFIGYSTTKTTSEDGNSKEEGTSNQLGIIGAANSKFLVSFYF